ncbi:MAG: flagellar hook-associated protein FlgK [Alphaproteobacteria bacterium]|nr:flagellar hook-associated protein FlgK [Alphaproteobacteria bacterium]
MSGGTLTTAFRSGLSALQTAQAGLAVASQNIANANTPGYVRAEASLAPRVLLGPGGGVEISSVRRAADRFLAAASYYAEAQRGAADVRSGLIARAQAAFGDPTGETSLFAGIDRIWGAFAELGVDSTSALRRDSAVQSIQQTFYGIERAATDVQALITEADERIAEKVGEAQNLITRIHELNGEIRLTRRVAGEATGAENAQSALIDKLSGLLDIRVTPQGDGTVTVRTAQGALLVGEQVATISYSPSGATFTSFNAIQYQIASDVTTNLEPYISGGELGGLLQARDGDLRNLAEALGGLSAGLADTLNQVHNQNAPYPVTGALTGRQTGLLSTDALNFTGTATIGLVDSAGALSQRLTILFDAAPPRIDVETSSGTTSTTFTNTIGAFTTALNTALGAGGSAAFSNGRLSITPTSGGVVVQQDEPSAGGAARAGRGFSHFFGLNDLASRATPIFFETGGVAGDAHGLNSGGALSFDIRDGSGRIIAQPTFTIAGALTNPGSTWSDLVTALNNTTTGLGRYVTFSYASDGRITFTPNAGFQANLTDDTTSRGATTLSVSTLFGLGPSASATRAVDIKVAQAILNDPGRLALGRPDLSAQLTTTVSEAGDARGAAELSKAGNVIRTFPAVGALSAQTGTLSVYAARISGDVGRAASDSERSLRGAQALANAANDRRAEVEGVNLDDEFIRLTTYQNAYAAASRVIQAADEMFDVLLNLGR